MDKTLTYLGWLAFAIAILLILSGCTTTGNLCSAGPFIADPGADQRLTRSEKEYVVALNDAGMDVCGWKALS